jgi:EAL domain-containing protein (putative c-di-GMP-specific phosphodiesterase class I)/CheY-like chemotaxis protein
MNSMWSSFADTNAADLDPGGARAAASDAGRMPSVLLVDDDPYMLGVQARMLRSAGFDRLGTADSAGVALETLQRTAVDVIVCDLNMPGIDGIEFLQTVKRRRFKGNVILLSSEGARILHAVQKLLGPELVVLGTLEKPARQADLQALLAQWHRTPGARARAAAPAFAPEDIQEANRSRQWVLHYQPKVELEHGAVTGLEALVRWQHPTQGLLGPDRFITVAEDCGAIDGLTQWVLEEATEQLARWHAARLPVQMAVNLSMENLRAPQFVPDLLATVRKRGLSPADLTLEITESRVMDASPVPLENLVRLRMRRFGLSIDDFGTGHSSLAQLRDVPFTELKVDRGFVRGARHNRIIRPMLEGSVGIARRLQMRSVAEGVETEDDWNLVREIGCDVAQGWFIAAAMPAEAIPGWLAAWEARRPGLARP